MDYATWSQTQLKRISIRDGRQVTSVWCSSPSDLPLIVLVHGISGDHAGLVALAHDLVKTHRVAIVDLPGHGKSSAFPLPNATALQQWFNRTIDAIEQKIGPIAAICAHSFGCSAVLDEEMIRRHKIILLNPVPTPSAMYARYSRMIMDSAHFWAHIYNWRGFILLRGMTLAKVRTREAMRRVRWVGWNSRATYSQIVFQSRLVDIILDADAYKHARQGVALVVCGMFDTTALERDSLDMEEVFGATRVVFLRGGHLLPIESPGRVASLIREVVVN